MNRRDFFACAALSGVGLASSSIALPGAAAFAAPSDLEVKADEFSDELFAADGLARPIPSSPTASDPVAGLDRTLVLGGGGEYYVAWYCGFFHGLYELGIDMNALSEFAVGTSAGPYVGSSLTSGQFKRMRLEMDFFGEFPKLFAKLAPVSAPNASQQRALKINAAATDGSIETIRTIGRAALAADNALNGERVERLAALLTGDSKTDWPVARMVTSAMDCYTGERLIVTQDAARKNGIPLAHGAAASSSLPGSIGPTLLGQRFCMDGGICPNAAHVDVVAGSKRAIVITLTDGTKPPSLTGIPHRLQQDIDDLQSTGTQVLWIVANLPDVNLLDPTQMASALRTGYERAKTEGPGIKAFWA